MQNLKLVSSQLVGSTARLYVDEFAHPAYGTSFTKRNFAVIGVGFGVVVEGQDDFEVLRVVHDVRQWNSGDDWFAVAGVSYPQLKKLFFRFNPEIIYACNNIGEWLKKYIRHEYKMNGQWTSREARIVYHHIRTIGKFERTSEHYELKERVGEEVRNRVKAKIPKIRNALETGKVARELMIPSVEDD